MRHLKKTPAPIFNDLSRPKVFNPFLLQFSSLDCAAKEKLFEGKKNLKVEGCKSFHQKSFVALWSSNRSSCIAFFALNTLAPHLFAVALQLQVLLFCRGT